MYVLLYMYDTENGNGVEAIAVSEDKLNLRSLMQENANKLKGVMEEFESRDDLWNPDCTEYGEDFINLGYDDGDFPNKWRWEIQRIGTEGMEPIKVVVIVEDGTVQEGYSNHPELVDIEVVDLDDAAVEDDEEIFTALYDAADEARKTLQPAY